MVSIRAKRKACNQELPASKKRERLGSAPLRSGTAANTCGQSQSNQALPTPPDSRFESAEAQTIENLTGRPQRAARLRSHRQSTFFSDPTDSESDNEPSEQHQEENEDPSFEDETPGVEDGNEAVEDGEADDDDSVDAEVEGFPPAKPSRAQARTTRGRTTKAHTTKAETTKARKTKAPKCTFTNNPRTSLDPTLPPLSNIQDIFTDLTQKAIDNGLDSVLEVLAGTKLRVATMCSGTESPLLALQLASSSLEKLGRKPLQLEHVFSAEIVPRKQAYIERNFKPPVIFRDVREFSQDDAREQGATNVYGAKVQIPGDVDLLVAGASCVDYSRLNSQQGKVTKGESKDTLDAVLEYVGKWKPTIVLFENIVSAPWQTWMEQASDHGYQAELVKVDTKDFYLPQTRTRGYMLWVRQDCSKDKSETLDLDQWCQLMSKTFKRRASAPASAFLLPSDDPRVHQFNSELSRVYQNSARARAIEWDACRRRHENVRSEEELGEKKPITEWVKGGSCVAYEHAHRPWLLKMPERVWDSIDIRFLRAAQGGLDPLFKTMIMELSQNVDRTTETAFGVCSCITPSGIFYLTDRATPMTPHETLALQGIPLDRISLTLESMTEVQDLAGNAMSSTVVGAAQLAALIVAWRALKRSGNRCAQMSVAKPEASPSFVGHELLEVSHDDQSCQRLDPGFEVSKICVGAITSRRRCACEGTWDDTPTSPLVCIDCGHRACSSCAGKPKHNYRPDESTFSKPQEFSDRWKSHLPIALHFKGLPEIADLKDSILRYFPFPYNLLDKSDRQLLDDYCDAIDSVRDDKLTFQCLKRTSYVPWVARYASSKAVAELEIGASAEWKLYVKPSNRLASNGSIRKILESPVARAKLSSASWTADWEWLIPSSKEYPIQIIGSEEKRPSWRCEYGLIQYQEETIPSWLEIESTSRPIPDVFGKFQHVSHCGTACSSLYRRDGARPLYLFLDPTRVGSIAEDRFVFSYNPERLDYGESRETVATLNPKFRPWHPQNFSTTVTVPSWIKDGTTTMVPVDLNRVIKRSRVAYNEQRIALKCSEVLTILNVKCHHHGVEPGIYRAVESDVGDFFSKFSWMLENGAELPALKDWMSLGNNLHTACTQCSPLPPPLRWRQEGDSRGTKKFQLVSHEDPHLSAEFERGLKTRPSILEAEAEVNPTSGVCSIKMGVNPTSLAHRAWGLLKKDHAALSWNLDSKWTTYGAGKFSPFKLENNKQDLEHVQPPGFRIQLKPSQKRSLTWMRSQEKGVPFTVEEVEEEVIAPLHWKIEGRAQADLTVKGGVVADQVSFGKTVTSLAMIHQGFLDTQDPAPDDSSGLIHVKATLVVVPAQLPDQWLGQIRKCLDNSVYSEEYVLVINSTKELKSLTIKDFETAKIIVVSFALFESDSYMAQFQHITAMPDPSTKEGRYFMEWFKYASNRIPDMNSTLTNLGVKGFQKYLKEEGKNVRNHVDFSGIAPTKRTKGAKYQGFAPMEQKVRSEESDDTSHMDRFGAPSGDWKKLQCPIFHQFRFNRLIVDEFTYPMEMKASRKNQILLHTHLTTLNADKRWILSGTPPLSDFADIKRIASYLDINLGVDCDAPGIISQENVKTLRKEQTDFELFLSFRTKRSAAWHERRHLLAQDFLYKFARQNVAELQHIKCSVSLHPVWLRPHHMAAYQELAAQLDARDNNVKDAMPDRKDDGHRFEQIRQSLVGQESSDDALVTCAASNRVDLQGENTACLSVIEQRKAEMRAKDTRMKGLIEIAERLQRNFPSQAKEYGDWAAKYLAESPIVCDKKSHKDIRQVIREKMRATNLFNTAGNGETLQNFVRNTLTAEERRYVDARRSLRSSRAVALTVDSYRQNVNMKCECCKHEANALDSAVLIGCGHVVCQACLGLVLEARKCNINNGCDMDVSHSSVLRANTFCALPDLLSNEDSFGAKLDDIVDLVEDRSKIKDEEQVIIFVQSQDMVERMGDALKSRDVPYSGLSRAETRSSGIIKAFVENKRLINGKFNKKFKRVLILNQTDESAAGTDLFNANHVIFVSPLSETTEQAYQAKMDQAIGRARRLGQKKHVHVYRFFAMHTIDVELLERLERRHDGLVQGPEVTLLWDPESTKVKELCHVVECNDGKVALLPESWVKDPLKARDAGIDFGAAAEET
ncbi:hypothetical protein IWX49DRAFT_131380 [Phyllosticta citricarpa]|uniref:Helicase C-terminal domain-containing protein n=1 Tax=Phyllosticta paracitricarpa TaxID=2016321 RepID=A0ABR1N2V7_9PEZI